MTQKSTDKILWTVDDLISAGIGSRASIYRKLEDPNSTFPKPFFLEDDRPKWKRSTIEKWLDAHEENSELESRIPRQRAAQRAAVEAVKA